MKGSVFIYEFVTGGGFLADKNFVPPSLAREGRAMACGLASDFAAAGFETVLLHDARQPALDIAAAQVFSVDSGEDHQRRFSQLAAAADWTVVIAPELDDQLSQCCDRVQLAGGRLLGPSVELIHLASDKHALGQFWQTRGVSTPEGVAIPNASMLPDCFAYPAVLKPRFGAGSVDVRRIESAADLGAISPLAGDARLETYHPGEPVSVSFLCGPKGDVALPSCRQHLSEDGRFQYLGGSLLTDMALGRRATDLAERALSCLPSRRGFLGVDLILGDNPDDGGDVAIELNPRLTMSYVGLRAACRGNLAEAMLNVAHGNAAEIDFDTSPLAYDTSGRVTRGAVVH